MSLLHLCDVCSSSSKEGYFYQMNKKYFPYIKIRNIERNEVIEEYSPDIDLCESCFAKFKEFVKGSK